MVPGYQKALTPWHNTLLRTYSFLYTPLKNADQHAVLQSSTKSIKKHLKFNNSPHLGPFCSFSLNFSSAHLQEPRDFQAFMHKESGSDLYLGKMYKSRLQELCNKKKWALPIYSCMREGPDHNPQFKASVVVNGTNFGAATVCKSMKDAHNEAAKLAFLHFTSGSLERSDVEDQKSGRKLQSSEVQPEAMDTQNDLEQRYKMKLQVYAQRKDLGLPLYCTNEEGAPNAPIYKTTVTIAGDTFESPACYRTVKQGEEAAAQATLVSLSTEAFRSNDIHKYKNLLQEFSLKEGFFRPNYATARTGEAHDPVFSSTMEVEGEIFKGNPGKSKKQAENNAARVAYECFIQRKSSQIYEFASSATDNDILKLAASAEGLNLADPRSSINYEPPVSIPSSKCDAIVEDSEGRILPHYHLNCSSRIVITNATRSYLLCDRIRVYTSIPDVDACKGNVVLPIAEDKWVVASLEFAE